jgi:hypothetical protein
MGHEWMRRTALAVLEAVDSRQEGEADDEAARSCS